MSDDDLCTETAEGKYSVNNTATVKASNTDRNPYFVSLYKSISPGNAQSSGSRSSKKLTFSSLQDETRRSCLASPRIRARRQVNLRPVTIHRVLSTGQTEQSVGWPLNEREAQLTNPVRKRSHKRECITDKDINQTYNKFQVCPTVCSDTNNLLEATKSSSQIKARTITISSSAVREKNRGLRYFSMRVCDKVKEKVVTTYNEVADELVNEYYSDDINPGFIPTESAKNIRRRVYDAINVLMAINIIVREKKEIRWVGFPSAALEECQLLEKEKRYIFLTIQDKSIILKDLILYNISLKQLINRNRTLHPWMISNDKITKQPIIKIPFIIVYFGSDNHVDCYVSSDRKEYMFRFDQPYNIQGDGEVMRELGLTSGLCEGNCTPDETAKICCMMPRQFSEYIIQLSRSTILRPLYNLNGRRRRRILPDSFAK
ncbi:hypothetical protein GJ496_001649 [Pomphorhynchus laevis]|nr:hypothetical protein GJ496_001649 [Pomphorhynchus laevis]